MSKETIYAVYKDGHYIEAGTSKELAARHQIAPDAIEKAVMRTEAQRSKGANVSHVVVVPLAAAVRPPAPLTAEGVRTRDLTAALMRSQGCSISDVALSLGLTRYAVEQALKRALCGSRYEADLIEVDDG